MIHVSESQIQKATIEYLQVMENLGQLIFLRNNSFAGKIMRGDSSIGYVNNAKKGSPDLFIFLKQGKTIHLELKSHTGKLRADQIIWREKAEKLGHIFRVARSFEDVEEIIKFYTKKQ